MNADPAVEELDVVGRRHLPPDPELVKALGLNHALESAIADLVDNSIDANASHVLIRFVWRSDRLVSLLLVDDGDGMTETELDAAMTIGKRRSYRRGSLGHFGLGLKAASFSQAGGLTVLSRAAAHPAVGLRWLREKARAGFDCDVIAGERAAEVLDTKWGPLKTTTGTVVRWNDVSAFPTSSDPAVATGWLEMTLTRLRHHLGLVFHRLLAARGLEVLIDVYDADLGESGALYSVEPLNPFDYGRSGKPGYPKTLRAPLAGKTLELACYIWPARSDLPQFRLPGGQPESFQGFYFYRNDRLLQAGGWNGVHLLHRRLRLARIAVDIDDEFHDVFTMNPEKKGIIAKPAFAVAVESAKASDGTTFSSYLIDAEEAYRRATRRGTRRAKVIPPGRGIASAVRDVIGKELDFVPGEEPINIRWRPLPEWDLFAIARDERIIWLNSRYRSAILKGRAGSLNDAPLVKALIYLLMEDVFKGSYLGPKDRDNIDLWQSILTEAADEEMRNE